MQSYAKPHTAVCAVLISSAEPQVSTPCCQMQAVQGVIDREDLAAADMQKQDLAAADMQKHAQAKADVEALEMIVEGFSCFRDSWSKSLIDTDDALNHLDNAVQSLQHIVKDMDQTVQQLKRGRKSLDRVEQDVRELLRTAQGRADPCGSTDIDEEADGQS